MGLLTFWSRCPKIMAVRMNGRRNPTDGMGSRIKLDNRNEAHDNAEWSRQTSFTLHDTPEPGLVHRPNDQGWVRSEARRSHMLMAGGGVVRLSQLGYLGKCDAPCKRPYLEWTGGGAILHFIARQAARFTFTRAGLVGTRDAPPQ